MSDYQDPPLKLTIEGLRWMGDEFESMGEPCADITLYGTDSDEDAATALRALRALVVKRLQIQIPALMLRFDRLEFDAPNFPTEDDVKSLVQTGERIVESLRALKQLAAEVIDDDEGGEDEPPEPEPSAELSSEGDGDGRIPASSPADSA